MAAAAVGQWRRGINPMTTGIGATLLLNLVITFAIPGISIGGHIGGAVAGAICGAVMLAPAYQGVPKWATYVTPIVVGLGSVVAVVVIVELTCSVTRRADGTARGASAPDAGARSTRSIIGGGINGAVTAASLAGRGASVALIDRGDFANFTSQASSNLVWGGFKYLENYELYLVWKLCRSRNRLMDAYPDNIKEIAFYAALDETSPYKPWFAGLGAFGYWLIGQFGTKRAAGAEPGEDRARGAGDRHLERARRHRVPRRDPDRQRCAVRVLVRAIGDRGRCRRGQLRRAGLGRTIGRPLDRPPARRRLRRGVHDHRLDDRQRRRARSSTS